ncbi:serine hydrolase domain-containing protein [Mangrovimicrobium sediminis]|nr:serine hydrolase [Haliea sp. SAOS-164]
MALSGWSRAILLSLLALVLLFFAALRLAGIPLRGVDDALPVATGLAAKLACSAMHLSGFDEAQVRRDIGRFSPVLDHVALSYPDSKQVRAELFGVSATARFYPGLGCTLQHAQMFPLESIEVPAVPAPAAALPLADATPMQALVEAQLAADRDAGLDTRALLVVRAGKVLGEAYAPGIDAQTALLGWSMGKSVTAMMAGRLEALGLLTPGETDLFSAWSGDERAAITLEQMLQMSSGLDFSEPYVPGNDSTRMLFTAPSASAVAMASPLAFPPGSHFAYSSGTTNLLCRLVSERLTGGPQALVDFFQREVVAPLGLQNTTLELDPSGVFVGSSYIYASARDWARLAQPLLRDGRVGDAQWLPAGWVARATAPNPSDNEPRYGYQFWLNGTQGELRWPALPVDTFAMSGHNGQEVVIVPSRDTVLVRLGWTQGTYPMEARFADLLAALPPAD